MRARCSSSRMLAILLVVGITNLASAHFPWIVVNEQGQAVYFFGENIADRTYHLPPSIATAKLFALDAGKSTAIETKPVDSEKLVGLQSELALPPQAAVVSQVTFGIYHGARLEYYTQYLGRNLPKRFADCQLLPAALQAHAVDTDSGVDVYVLWQGKPLVDTEVKLFSAAGDQSGSVKTDASGKVSFSDQQVEAGINGIMLGHMLDKQAGKLDGKDYASVSHYLTATFPDPEAPAPTIRGEAIEQTQPAANTTEKTPLSNEKPAVSQPSAIAELPFGITSFGAARLGEAIYVYGGHTGSAHSYSDEGQSNALLKLSLAQPSKPWQVIATGERLQGLGMVAHDSRLIFVGGFQARNKEGEDHDLHSISNVRVYDVNSDQWSDLPSLPQGRSSHDAAVVGDTLYVVGGWMMDGKQETHWHTTALAMDLTQADPKWTEIAEPNFKRRALALAAHQHKLYVIGGMNEEGGPTRVVEVFDPASNSWTTGPELKGESGMDGFGASAWSQNGRLTVTNIRGDIQVLSQDGHSWQSSGSTRDARFFHRLLPFSETSFVSIGGASMESGKFLVPEVVEVK